MRKRRPTNLDLSVRSRLLSYAHERGEEFGLVLSRYAVERFLNRLAQSRHDRRFVLKGAYLFMLWGGEMHLVTRDLDLLGSGSNDISALEQTVRDICDTEVPEDGIRFLSETVRGSTIREDQEYEGIRITLQARIGAARVPLQIDIGFGDVIMPDVQYEVFPGILDFEAPRPQSYPRETVIAEKFQAMVQLGMANSRMKDFYDVWFLARSFSFEGSILANAVVRTFERRRTPIPQEPPLALTTVFSNDSAKRKQWAAFLRRGRLRSVALEEVVLISADFLMIPSEACTCPVDTRKTVAAGWPLEGAVLRAPFGCI